MGLFSKFIAKIKGTNDFSPADWADLEQELLASDVGPRLTQQFLESAKKVKTVLVLPVLVMVTPESMVRLPLPFWVQLPPEQILP
ncbi:hypothetical protein EBT25_18080 [bacterium]|nr:hypothetical protein [bacterium]